MNGAQRQDQLLDRQTERANRSQLSRLGLALYKSTDKWMTVVMKLLGVDLRITGAENLVDRPTLFVANHFTRIETFLIPYAIYQCARRPVRNLGTHTLFDGLFGKYFRAIGGMSTKDPRRNRTIVRDLITGDHDWLIYPEGGLVKNKKTVKRGRLRLERPHRQGPPHTGAAVLALKAQMSKSRFRKACQLNDTQRLAYYSESYDLTDPNEVSNDAVAIVPITINFYPLRPGRNLLNRIASLMVRDLDPRLDEELQVDGRILFADTEIGIHFSEPIEVQDYLGAVPGAARKVMGIFSEPRRADLLLGRQAKRLTEDCVRAIYNRMEVNLDHLVCYGLRALQHDRVRAADFHRSLYLAAVRLEELETIRLHPVLGNGIAALLRGESFAPLRNILRVARKERVLRRDGDHYVLDRSALLSEHDFHKIRLNGVIQVIANELEPLKPAVRIVEQCVNLPSAKLKEQVAATLQRRDVRRFEQDRAETSEPELSKPREVGEPFLLENRSDEIGVVLVHGYLASPEQLRPMATYLHDHGCWVYSVRLPGHGTSPEQMINATWHDWIAAVFRGHAILRQRCHRLVIGGFSLGGTLAMMAAGQGLKRLDGVFSINAPVRLRDRRASLIPAIVNFNGMLRKLGLSKGYLRRPNYATSHPETNYEIDYLCSVKELGRAVRACRRSLRLVSAPALVVQGDADPTVDPISAKLLMKRLGSECKMLARLPFDRHVIVRDAGSEEVFRRVTRFVTQIAGNGHSQ